MQTRRKHCAITFEPEAPLVRKLLARHLRQDGDDSQESCPICLVEFAFRETIPALVQCPNCLRVFHLACMDVVVKRCDDNAFSCPSCRGSTDVCDYEDADTWNADAAVDAMLEEEDDDYVEVVAGGCSSQDESERRHLRSHTRRSNHGPPA